MTTDSRASELVLSQLGGVAEGLLFADRLGRKTGRARVISVGAREVHAPRHCTWEPVQPERATEEVLPRADATSIVVWVDDVGFPARSCISLLDECCKRGSIVVTVFRSHTPSPGHRTHRIEVRDPLLCQPGSQPGAPLAILAAYNEADVIEETVLGLVRGGCDVTVIDNWSTDATAAIVSAMAASHPGRITLEVFPETAPTHGEWRAILRRKEEIALRHPGRWIIHSDADEMRRFPKPGVSLQRGFEIVRSRGYNRIDFCVINFLPVDEAAYRGPLLEQLSHFEFGRRPGHFAQHKAWLQGAERVDLASSGGHSVTFDDARDFPYRWLVQHFPLRSAEHARRKIVRERKSRWAPDEHDVLGWHVQYDGWDETANVPATPGALHRWNERTFWDEHGLAVISEDVQRSRDIPGGV